MQKISASACLPDDLDQALLIGRVWRRDGAHEGPCVVAVRGGHVFDITKTVPTTADLFDRDDAVDVARNAPGDALGPVTALLDAALAVRGDASTPRLLAPCDVQAIKAAGVTFAVSLLERVIEEQAGGDATRAEQIRIDLQRTIGSD